MLFFCKGAYSLYKKHLIRKHHAVQLFHENVQIRNEDDPPLNDISEEGTSAIELTLCKFSSNGVCTHFKINSILKNKVRLCHVVNEHQLLSRSLFCDK
jgi:hypothetical protein